MKKVFLVCAILALFAGCDKEKDPAVSSADAAVVSDAADAVDVAVDVTADVAVDVTAVSASDASSPTD